MDADSNALTVALITPKASNHTATAFTHNLHVKFNTPSYHPLPDAGKRDASSART